MSKTKLNLDITELDLSLSGGGFRATIFHLGVVGYLRDARLLPKLKVVCGVSGGSILAAHLTTFWSSYVTTDDEFKGIASKLLKTISEKDISGNVWAASKERLQNFKSLDSSLLIGAYDELLQIPTTTEDQRVLRWDDLKNDHSNPARPKLYVMATHLNTGQPCSFSSDGFQILPPDPSHRKCEDIRSFIELANGFKIGHQSISRAVAASSAFPPVFSPVALDENGQHQLTDGGVYDNSGARFLEYLHTTGQIKDEVGDRLIIISDAGKEFPFRLGVDYDSLMGLAMRVTDTQANRISQFDSKAVAKHFASKDDKCHVLQVSIQDRVEFSGEFSKNHTDKVQELLANIRTELDVFSAEEILVLYRHGYLVAKKKLAELTKGFPTDAKTKWLPMDETSSLDKNLLEKRLADSHLIKKVSEVESDVRSMILQLALRQYWPIGLFLVAVCVFACIATYLLGLSRGTPKRPAATVSSDVKFLVEYDIRSVELGDVSILQKSIFSDMMSSGDRKKITSWFVLRSNDAQSDICGDIKVRSLDTDNFELRKSVLPCRVGANGGLVYLPNWGKRNSVINITVGNLAKGEKAEIILGLEGDGRIGADRANQILEFVWSERPKKQNE